MKHSVATLEGAMLDAAVAMCEGDALPDSWRDPNDGTCWARIAREEWAPSQRWCQGGPLVERERIELAGCIDGDGSGGWLARHGMGRDWQAFGATALIAGMRAYVMHKIGPEVDLT